MDKLESRKNPFMSHFEGEVFDVVDVWKIENLWLKHDGKN
jgi:hypothetical protein